MKRDIVTSAIGILVFTLVLGILYPLVVTGISQVAFPGNANGQKVDVDGRLVGSKIIGQQFATQVVKNGKPVVDKDGNPVTQPDPRYFQSRPSPTVPPYNAGASHVLQPWPQRRRHRAVDRGLLEGLPGAREAI